MCGIAGWVDHSLPAHEHRDRLQAMNTTMACRGPDAEGSWFDGPVALGHRRLAVIDPPSGTQPMAVRGAGGRIALTYSGELYNHAELRRELRSLGHTFATSSDTEVVLLAWAQWGPDSLTRFNGMYAFAVWDEGQRTLWLARDRLGVKPLYYAPTENGAVFGSEPKALFAHGVLRPDLDGEGLAQVMLPLLKVPGASPYRGMSEVRPGHLVRVGPQGTTERAYWRLEAREHRDDWPTTVEYVRELLTDAVHRQCEADVPGATLLSGGLDSTAVTGWARGCVQGRGFGSYSVDFDTHGHPGGGTEDAPYVEQAAAHLGCDHTTLTLSGKELADPGVREACVRARDLPVGIGDLDLSLYLLFGAVGERATVALSGEAADEVFGGYRWFHDPTATRAGTFPWMADSPAHGRLHQRIVEVFRPELVRDLRLSEYVSDQYATAMAEVDPLPGEDPHQARMREIGHLALTRFLPTLLDRKDRMSMAVGLEVRVPFCDHRLVEYLHNVPWRWKVRDGQEKSVLRAASADVVPPAIRDRPKVPYPSTRDHEYTRLLNERTTEVGAEPADGLDTFLDVDALAERPGSPGSLISNVGAEVALNFDTWLREYRPDVRTP